MARLKRIFIRFVVGMTVLIALLFGGVALALQFLPSVSFRPIEGATRVEVEGNLGGRARIIKDPDQVRQITAFVNRYPSGWGGSSGLFGVPVPQVIANFYRGEEFLGHFGAGTNFFETQRQGTF